jgi:propanediol dehydratase small subunit
MTELGVQDYPLAETRPGDVRGRHGKSLDAITLNAVMAGEVTMEDLRITPAALRDQARIARAAGRSTLAANFERAAELVEVPQDLIMDTYELLRPGRAKSKKEILERARVLRETHGAAGIAAFLEDAAEAYERRGLFTFRF